MTTISNGNFNPHMFEEMGSLFTQAMANKAPETALQKIAEKTAELCRESLFSFIKTFADSKEDSKYFF